MKKLSFISCLALSVALFTACSGGSGDTVSSLKFYTNDGSVAPQYYSEAELTVVPNYKAKTLNVDFSRIFPNRTEETEDEDMKTSGDVGDEYFARFEELVELVRNFEKPEDVKEDDYLGSGVFGVVLTETGGEEVKIESFSNIEAADFQTLQSFYLDLMNLLTQEVPV